MEWKAKHNPKQLDWHRSARLRLSIALLLSVILLNTESLRVPSASSPSYCCKHRVGFTFNIHPHQRMHRPVKTAQQVTCIFISIQSAFSVWKCSRSSTKKKLKREARKSWNLPLNIIVSSWFLARWTSGRVSFSWVVSEARLEATTCEQTLTRQMAKAISPN